MLAFVTGICLGLALGWLSYLKREEISTAVFLYTLPTLLIVSRAVVLPTAVAAGAMDMGFLEFVRFAIQFYFGDFFALTASWFVVGALISRLGAWAFHSSYVPPDTIPETREESRRRVRAAMSYSDDYFD